MKTWILEPHDPVIARDGRPFTGAPGVRATTLPFPFPSTLAGAVRTRGGRNEEGIFTARVEDVKKLAASGPLLVQLDEDGRIQEWFAPAPADALLLESKTGQDHALLRQLKPLGMDEGLSAMPHGWLPVGLPDTAERGKPHGKAPRFWRWTQFEAWLTNPTDQTLALCELGLPGLLQDARTHVSVTPGSQTAEEGALFQTRGLEFAYRATGEKLSSTRRLALAIATDAEKIREGFDFLGGERRMSHWREAKVAAEQTDLFSSGCPAKVLNTIPTIQQNEWHCRVVLLTPAVFNQGAQPSWLEKAPKEVRVQIKAAALNRYQVVSGWDFELGLAKPTRRLAPAGTVFFLKLTGEKDKLTAWAKGLWMKCISDKEIDRRDGFGLAVIGNWDGNVEDLKYA